MRKVSILLATLFLAASAFAGEPPAERLDEILSRPEYNRWRGMEWREEEQTAYTYDSPWLDSLRRTFEDWWNSWERRERKRERRQQMEHRASNWGGDAAGFFRIFGYVILGAMALFLAYSIYLWVAETRKGGKKNRPGAGAGLARALATGDALAFDDATWHNEAERLLGEGDFRHAYRALYLGLLSGLDERGRIAYIPNRTNWHYVRTFRGDAAMRSEFAELTDFFDRVWYGFSYGIPGQEIPGLRTRIDALLGDSGRDGTAHG